VWRAARDRLIWLRSPPTDGSPPLRQVILEPRRTRALALQAPDGVVGVDARGPAAVGGDLAIAGKVVEEVELIGQHVDRAGEMAEAQPVASREVVGNAPAAATSTGPFLSEVRVIHCARVIAGPAAGRLVVVVQIDETSALSPLDPSDASNEG
jgi:hypothetical protein